MFRIERQRTQRRTGKVEEEVVNGVTSLRSERADAADALALLGVEVNIK